MRAPLSWLLCPLICLHHSLNVSLLSGVRRCSGSSCPFPASVLESALSLGSCGSLEWRSGCQVCPLLLALGVLVSCLWLLVIQDPAPVCLWGPPGLPPRTVTPLSLLRFCPRVTSLAAGLQSSVSWCPLLTWGGVWSFIHFFVSRI